MTDSESKILSPEARLRALLQELVDRYTKRPPVAERHGGCGWCGGLPHTIDCLVGRADAALAAPPAEESGITVIYPGGLTDREHALFQAFRWQRAHAVENSPSPSEVYVIISRLLSLLPDAEVAAAFLTFTQQGPA